MLMINGVKCSCGSERLSIRKDKLDFPMIVVSADRVSIDLRCGKCQRVWRFMGKGFYVPATLGKIDAEAPLVGDDAHGA